MPRHGVTLTELMIATMLLSVVFIGATSAYVSSTAALKAQGDNKADYLSSYAAMEHMARRIRLGNQVAIDPNGRQIKVRWDYAASEQPLSLPCDAPNATTACTWVKYKLFTSGGEDKTLRWRIDSAQAGDVASGDPQVQVGLRVQPGALFALENPPTGPLIVDVTLVTDVGTPPVTKLLTLRTAATLRAKAENP